MARPKHGRLQRGQGKSPAESARGDVTSTSRNPRWSKNARSAFRTCADHQGQRNHIRAHARVPWNASRSAAQLRHSRAGPGSVGESGRSGAGVRSTGRNRARHLTTSCSCSGRGSIHGVCVWRTASTRKGAALLGTYQHVHVTCKQAESSLVRRTRHAPDA